ncbi:MAG: hypothetical protein NZ583_08115 [Desulfobacterota bacterium]|nr:hypothetical protein [Thermodesulfobacteriota bacterium]MDW8002212.1 hypothetical protein [Deltaproteobacteria bacterium]
MEDLLGGCTTEESTMMVDRVEGVALISILALIVIGSILVGVVLYLLERGTEISILEKKYRVEKEAALGAIEFLCTEILPDSIQVASQSGDVIAKIANKYRSSEMTRFTFITSNECIRDKLLKNTNQWANLCSSSSDPKVSPDIKFTLKSEGDIPFGVYVKIVETVAGNTSTQPVSLEGGGVTDTQAGIISPQHFPYLYRIEVQAEREINPKERVNLEVLFAY